MHSSISFLTTCVKNDWESRFNSYVDVDWTREILLKNVLWTSLQELKIKVDNNWNCKHPRKQWMFVCVWVGGRISGNAV